MRLIWSVAIVFIALQLADFYTTWACLHEPIPGYEVYEVNPISAMLFLWIGLVPGLILDTFLGTILTIWIAKSRFSFRFRLGVLVCLSAITAFAVVGNYFNMVELGIA